MPGHEGGLQVELKAIRPAGKYVSLFGLGGLIISYSARHAQAVEGTVVLNESAWRAAAAPRTAALTVLVLFALALAGGVAGLRWSGGLAVILGGVELVLVVITRRAQVRASLDPDRELVTIHWKE